jgi:hypothetical protein
MLGNLNYFMYKAQCIIKFLNIVFLNPIFTYYCNIRFMKYLQWGGRNFYPT